MPLFSQLSVSKLSTCHPELQTLFYEVVRHVDCVVLEGHRDEADQHAAFLAGNSKLDWPLGKHNGKPSMAIDVSPYPIPSMTDKRKLVNFIYFGGFVMGIASRLLAEGKMTRGVRYGGDWNMNEDVTDQSFVDAVHFELIGS